ncbi:MAG: penicillin-binding protein activator [Calditrichaceae bacterium]
MRFLLVVFVFTVLFGTGFAQKASNREWAIFQRGVEQYKSGEYEAAEKNFSLVISKLPDNQLLTANYLMLAKTQYKQEDYTASLNLCETFLRDFPGSSYTDDFYYIMGNNYYRLNRFQTAVSAWLAAAEHTRSGALKENSLKLIKKTMQYKLDMSALLDLKDEIKTPFSRHALLYYMAERQYAAGDVISASFSLDEVLKSTQQDEFTSSARELYDNIKNQKSNTIRIAVLLPVSGSNSDIGKALLDGLNLAVSDFNRSLQGKTVDIVVYDYETKLPVAMQKIKEIARDPSIHAIFGPVENDITAACAGIADYEGLTLITPTASSNDLAYISDRLIQLAPTVDALANSLVQFAEDSLKIKRVATLSPVEDYFVNFTDSFVERHEQNGGTVVAQQWYYPGDQDFSKQFKAIKRIGLKLTFQDSVMEKKPSMDPIKIDSLYAAYRKEKMEKNDENKTKIDSADIPVKSIDALLIPVYKDDIGLIAPQLAYANFKTHLLGNGDWYNSDALRKNKNYINGIIFVSDGYLNEESWDYKQFRNNFRTQFSRTPERFELVGYDSFNFILKAVSREGVFLSRSNFYQVVMQEPPYQGVYRNFDVGSKHYNSAVRVIKYIYGQFIPLN